MNCPTCGHDASQVLTTKATDDRVTRQRQCCRCGKRWKTVEADVGMLDRAARILEAARTLQDLAGEA